MINHKKLAETVIVDCSAHGFGPFSVLIVPIPDDQVETLRHFYLIHKHYGIVTDMFGTANISDEEAINMAYYNALDYMPDFIKACSDEE